MHVIDAVMKYVQKLEEHNLNYFDMHKKLKNRNKRYREVLESIRNKSKGDYFKTDIYILADEALEESE